MSATPDGFDLGLTPAERPEDAPRPFGTWPQPARWAVGIGSGCAGLVLFGSLAAYGGMLLLARTQPPAGLRAEAVVPSRTPPSKPFTLTLTVRNAGREPFTIDAVRVSPSTAERFSFGDPKPAPTTPQLGFGGKTWAYNQQMAPGAAWTLKIPVTPTVTGKQKGELQLQTGIATTTVPFETQIGDADSPQRGTKPKAVAPEK
ncbi:MAG: hypothetical protein ACK47B_04700 [Armatimonadota bacterium]